MTLQVLNRHMLGNFLYLQYIISLIRRSLCFTSCFSLKVLRVFSPFALLLLKTLVVGQGGGLRLFPSLVVQIIFSEYQFPGNNNFLQKVWIICSSSEVFRVSYFICKISTLGGDFLLNCSITEVGTGPSIEDIKHYDFL